MKRVCLSIAVCVSVCLFLWRMGVCMHDRTALMRQSCVCRLAGHVCLDN